MANLPPDATLFSTRYVYLSLNLPVPSFYLVWVQAMGNCWVRPRGQVSVLDKRREGGRSTTATRKCQVSRRRVSFFFLCAFCIPRGQRTSKSARFPSARDTLVALLLGPQSNTTLPPTFEGQIPGSLTLHLPSTSLTLCRARSRGFAGCWRRRSGIIAQI